MLVADAFDKLKIPMLLLYMHRQSIRAKQARASGFEPGRVRIRTAVDNQLAILADVSIFMRWLT
jgi:hypothetical protein